MRSEWSTEHQVNGFSMAMGVGEDFVENRALAWRIALEVWNIRTGGFLRWIKSVHRRERDLPLGSLCVSERGNRKSCCSNGFLLEIWRFFVALAKG